MTALADLVSEARRAYAGRRWIVAVGAAAVAPGFVRSLLDWGADEVMVLAAAAGAGELPDAPVHYTGAAGADIMAGIRSFRESLVRPDDATRAAVESFDPAGEAGVLVEPMMAAVEVVDRPVFGARRPEWVALEDKTVVDELWDRAGVARSPSAVVPVAAAPQAAAELASEQGTVWAADNREGWHGGTAYTRWVPDAGEAPAAADWFRDRAHSVRVMPFLDGLPCSIHGYVASDGMAAFRPVEMIVFRTPDQTFQYAGPATFWDPPAEVRAEMRRAARQVCEVLADTVGYIGPFSIDGVCTANGFRPTELNPRLSPGLIMQARALALPLGAITAAYLEGVIRVPAVTLEEEIVASADSTRAGGLSMSVDGNVAAAEMGVDFTDGIAHRAKVGEGAGVIRVGSAPHGSHLLASFESDRVAAGPSLAPLAAQAAALASREWSLDLPVLVPAPDLRPGRPLG